MFTSRANVYTLLSNCEYIDQDVPNDFACHPEDYWPIMSERGDIWPEYYEAVHRSQAEANYLLARHYYQWILSFWREYREVVVVHTEPQAVSWQQDFQLIAEVISPEQCIKYLQQPARGNRFEGYEWAFESKDDGSEEGEVMDIE
jgi:chromo domain-containing protein 1